MFAGGAFSQASILALGIMPYISASIFMQLMTILIPQMAKVQKEGESGRKKINQWTRYLTALVTLFQAAAYVAYLKNVSRDALIEAYEPYFWISTIIVLTAGTLFVMWLGEKIQDNDGNSYIPINSTITSITFNSGTQEYTINISTNITANFTNKTLTIGENKYIYVKRSNDIHLYVRYYQEGSLVTKYILLNKSASWNTKWFKKNSINYSIIDQTITEDENITTDKINFSDYVVSGQSEYINGVSLGSFLLSNSNLTPIS
jgi:hypothetical protein